MEQRRAAPPACRTEHHQPKRTENAFAGVTRGNNKSVAVLARLGFVRVARFDSYDRYRLPLPPPIR
jgi:RimJ/RimL family protein N-acetyltransferase